MIEHVIEQMLPPMIGVLELMGICVVVISAVMAFARYIRGLVTRQEADIQFALANGMAIGLEFKMAAEILKTVLVHEISELIVLGAVILLRALLSFLIHFEMKQIHCKT